MTDTTNVHKCGKAECDVSVTGLCSDGLVPLEACPAYGKDPAPAQSTITKIEKAVLQRLVAKRNSQSGTSESTESSLTPIALPSGEALNIHDIEKMILRHKIKLVSIIGDRKSGKSTLIGTLYDKFSDGTFGSYAFSGSRTLVGFDKLSFYTRAESGVKEPDTIRTSIEEGLKFFHLELTDSSTWDSKSHLVISDRAGEVYKDARANTNLLSELNEIRMCLTLVILLDGEMIVDIAKKNNAFAAVRQTLRALSDIGAIGSSSNVQIVASKFDLVVKHANSAELIKQVNHFTAKLETEYAGKFAELSFWKIAARDPSHNTDLGHGLDSLLNDWMSKKRTQIKQSIPAPIIEGSEFDMLLHRVKY